MGCGASLSQQAKVKEKGPVFPDLTRVVHVKNGTDVNDGADVRNGTTAKNETNTRRNERVLSDQGDALLCGVKFAVGTPTVISDNVTACFEDGLLYRIIKGDTWAFFNDTRVYEMHIELVFVRSSSIQALGNTKVSQAGGKSGQLFEAVVYPGETAMFAKGNIVGFKGKIQALPLSEDYLRGRVHQYNKLIGPETANIASFANESKTDEQILAQCIGWVVPFIDIKFLPNQESITGGSDYLKKTVPWARPNMYLSESQIPQIALFRNTISPMIVDPGELGDTWLVCAIAALAEYPDMVRSMFSHPVSSEVAAKESELGARRVIINKSGWWHSVIVDDYLPVVSGRPKYARSMGDPCELWVSLLEKAYAKLYGSYANIIVGDPLSALQDFTGFPTSRCDKSFSEDMETGGTEFFEELERYSCNGYQIIISTTVRNSENANVENHLKDAGLRTGYAYPVRSVHHFDDENISLMQICNPWSDNVEWKGDWGATDSKWEENPEIAESCGRGTEAPGTFWMSWEDVKRYFNGCGVVFIQPNSIDYRVRGNFVYGVPDVCIQLTVKRKTSVACMLSQEDRRNLMAKEEGGKEYPPIMLSLSCGKGSLKKMQIVHNTHLDVDDPTTEFIFLRAREVSMLCTLTPECSPYLLIPRILSEEASLPYVVGLICGTEFGGDVKVEFCTLSQDNEVFNNVSSFSGEVSHVKATFQVRRPNGGFLREYVGKEIAKCTTLEKNNKTKGTNIFGTQNEKGKSNK